MYTGLHQQMSLIRNICCRFRPALAQLHWSNILHQQSKQSQDRNWLLCSAQHDGFSAMCSKSSNQDDYGKESSKSRDSKLLRNLVMAGTLGSFLGLKDKEEEPTGEEKIIHTIKLAKLSQQVNIFMIH